MPLYVYEANTSFDQTFTDMSNPLISLILCSRNDSYMGNSLWRLETSINLALIHAKEADFLNKLEIIVSDWGSKEPLSEVLNLITSGLDS